MPAWGSLSLLEAIWLVVAVAGCIYGVINVRTALRQRHFVRRKGLNGGRRLVTNGNVRRESLRLVGMVACLVLGMYAASPPYVQAPFLGWLAPLLLVIIMGTKAYSSFLDARENVALHQMLAIMEGAHKRNVERAAHAAGEHPA